MDVIAEHGAGVAVLRRYRRAGEGDESGIGQRIAQVLSVANLISRGRFSDHQCLPVIGGICYGQPEISANFQFGLETVLRPVRFVGNHYDVAALGQHREAVLILARHKFLDGREDDAAGWPVAQLGAQILPGICLHRLLAQQILRQRKHPEQLPVQIVAVSDDDDGRVFHCRFLHNPRGKAGHRDALAAALRMPHHAALVRAAGARCRYHLVNRRPHRMELVITGNLLDQRPVILEQHEEAQVIEQLRRRQNATNQRLQLVELAQRVERQAIYRSPLHEALGIAGKRTQPRLAAIRNDQQFVVLEHIGDLFLVGLNLVVGFPDVGLLVGRVLQLQQHQRQAIDEQNHIRPAGMVRAFDGKLVDRQPLVALRRIGRFGQVDQADEVTARLAIFLVFHRHAADQQFMEMAIGREQRRNTQIEYLLDRILTGRGRNGWIQPVDRSTQSISQNHLLVIPAFRALPVAGYIGPEEWRVTNLRQPA